MNSSRRCLSTTHDVEFFIGIVIGRGVDVSHSLVSSKLEVDECHSGNRYSEKFGVCLVSITREHEREYIE
jgi:hypothetical protein